METAGQRRRHFGAFIVSLGTYFSRYSSVSTTNFEQVDAA